MRDPPGPPSIFIHINEKEGIMTELNSKHPWLTPDTETFIRQLEAQNAPPLYTLSPREARDVLEKAQSAPTARPEVMIHDVTVPLCSGELPLRIMRPVGKHGRLPVIYYIHGGGWVMGSKETHDRLIRELVAGTGAALVFPSYTPSPEAQYPVPLRQLYGGLKAVAENADAWMLDASRIAVAGDSVGGNMSAALTLLAKAEKGPAIRIQILLYPVTDAAFDTESYCSFADGPWLTKKAMEWFWDAYAPDPASRNEITVSPLRATVEQLAGLPEAFVVTGQNDVLRDEGESYAYRLMQAGVRTTAVRYNGTIHDFMMLDALAGTEPAKAATEQVCRVLKQALFG